jgi:hypothetical protein
MRVSLKGYRLDPPGAEQLKSILSANRSSRCAAAVIDHVMSLGAVYAILEEPYIDQDYSADYLNFYAGAFRDYPRHTTRVHIFAEDVSKLLELPLAKQPEALAAAKYVGFVIVRPISQGPIGRTVLKFPDLGPKLVVRRGARADFKAHLFGAELKVGAAAPFIQQDERLGSCAQASIWMAARPVHERHRRTAWYSVAEITRLATTPTDAELSRSLPSGSGGLNPIHIIRALRAMGHQPLFDYFVPEKDKKRRKRSGDQESLDNASTYSAQLAAAAIVRYLDSGLPVVVALADMGQSVGHAITAVGFVEDAGGPCRAGTTYDCFVRALIVHDDQRGPYRVMPLTKADIPHLPKERLLTQGQDVLTVDTVTHMFVPLPPRVFLRADRVDTVSRDFLEQYVDQAGSKMVERITEVCGADAATTVANFHNVVSSRKLIRRTYLTSAGRYRHHLSNSDLSNDVKAELVIRSMPHFVWITELIDPAGSNTASGRARTIVGHMLLNAISSTDPNSDLLAVHLPHVVVHRDVNPPPEKKVPFIESALVFDDHAPYNGRLRH